MRRDPLQVLLRLRDAAMNEARRELADGLRREREGHRRVLEHGQAMLREQADAGGADAVDFALWLPRAREEATRLGAALRAEEDRVMRLQQALVARRTEVETVAAALTRRRNADALTRRRAEQAIMDEAVSRFRVGSQPE